MISDTDELIQNAIGVLYMAEKLENSTFCPTKEEALKAIEIATLHKISEKLGSDAGQN